MTIQVIDTTTVQPSGKIGDPAKTAFEKINSNFNELYGRPGKNLLINAEGLINQRGFAGGALAAGVYGYDRFKASTGGCNFSVSAGVWTHTSGPIVQVVEAPSGVYGSNVTFSVEDPSATISVTVGSVSGTIAAGSGRRGVTLSIPSGSGDLTVQWSATNATYKRPQLERGDSATRFEYRPNALEFMLCQQYYEKSYDLGVAPGTATEQGQAAFFLYGLTSANYAGGATSNLKVTKRATPAITLYSPQTGAVGKIYNAGNSADVSCAAVSIGQNGFFVTSDSFGPTVTINLRWQWTADAEL